MKTILEFLYKWGENHPVITIIILGVLFPVYAIPLLLITMGMMIYMNIYDK